MPVSSGATVRTVAAQTLGRYLVVPGDAEPAPLLVGFHGYGESAERHLEGLLRIPGVERWQVASVQALNRFYERRTGTVVGCWMTSQDRERAIEDNIAYVTAIVDELRGGSDTPLVFAGFSQGVAMAYRAALCSGHRCDGLVALAGDVPPELHGEPADRWPPVLLGGGLHDEWYTETKRDADLAFLSTRGILHETAIFDGGHDFHPDFHAAAGRFLERIRSQKSEGRSQKEAGAASGGLTGPITNG